MVKSYNVDINVLVNVLIVQVVKNNLVLYFIKVIVIRNVKEIYLVNMYVKIIVHMNIVVLVKKNVIQNVYIVNVKKLVVKFV